MSASDHACAISALHMRSHTCICAEGHCSWEARTTRVCEKVEVCALRQAEHGARLRSKVESLRHTHDIPEPHGGV